MVHAETTDELQNDWPGWTLWRSDGGSWMATRRTPKPTPPAGFFTRRGDLVLTLMERTERDLLKALENQAAIEQEIEVARATDHSTEHTVTPACPLACLGLQSGTEQALLAHWRGEGQYAATIADLLELRETRQLTTVFNIGWGRLGEIGRRLKAHQLGEGSR